MAVNTGAISNKNATKNGTAFISEVTDAWVLKTPVAGTTTLDLGTIQTRTLEQTASKEEFKNDAEVVVATDFSYSTTVTATLMERDKAKIDFLAHTVKGKYFLLYNYTGVVDGKNQEYFGLGTVTPQFNITLTGGASSMKFEFNTIFPTATVTFTGTQLTAIETALSISIYTTGVAITSAGYVIKETTV